MAVELHTFDPAGDVLLVLSRPMEDVEKVVDDEDGDSPTTQAGTAADPLSTMPVMENEAAVTQVEGDTNNENENTAQILNTDLKTEVEDNLVKPDVPVHLLVSSRHLMLASPVFRAMLQHSNFKEGHKLSSAGRVEIELPDDDPEAFIIILNIIHGRNRKVPRQVKLEMMSQIAILADKYHIIEALESFSDPWIEDLKVKLPEMSSAENNKQDVEMCMFTGVLFAFDRRVEFKETTRILTRLCSADLAERIGNKSPIPGIVVEKIQDKRRKVLYECYALVEDTIHRLQQGENMCWRRDDTKKRDACDSMLLGSLYKASSSKSLYPHPEAPYGQMSIQQMVSIVETLELYAFCDHLKNIWDMDRDNPEQNHGLHSRLLAEVKALDQGLSGLNLNDFKKLNKKKKKGIFLVCRG